MMITAPTSLVAGDTMEWVFSDSDRPSTDWDATAYLIGATVTASCTGSMATDGVAFDLVLSASLTTALPSGTYSLVHVLTSSSVRYTATSVSILVEPNPLSGPVDTRTHAAKVLAQINAAIEAIAANPYMSITIAGRTKMNWQLGELLKMRGQYEQIVRNEQASDRINRGEVGRPKIHVRFENP